MASTRGGAPPAYPGYDQKSAAQRYRGSFLNIESADLATFAPDGDSLTITSQRGTAALTPIGQDRFYAGFAENSRLPIAFFFNADAAPLYAMIGGAPYFPCEIDQSYQQEPRRWSAFEGLYKDPSNPNPAEMLTVRLRDDGLTIAEGEHEAACRAISDGCFLSELGLIEFERAGADEPPILIVGKATRFYPLDAQAFIQRGVIAYRREP